MIYLLKYATLRADIELDLVRIKHCCITCDAWSSISIESYLGVTCHYINDSFDMVSRVLSLTYLNSDHDADYLFDVLHKIFLEWNILQKVN